MNHNAPLPKTLFPFIWHFLKPHAFFVVLYVLLALATGFYHPFHNLLIKHLINRLPEVINGDINTLVFPASLVVLNFIIFDNVTWRSIWSIRAYFSPRILNDIISQCTDYVLQHSSQFYQDNLSGTVSKYITTLADGIEKLMHSVICNFLRGAVLLLTVMISVYWVNPIFSLIIVIWFGVFSSVSIMMSKRLAFLSNVQAKIESGVSGQLLDSISNHSNVRMFCRRLFELSRLSFFLGQQKQAYTATFLYSVWVSSVQGVLIAIMMACSTYVLVHLYGKGLVTVGDFALILGLCMQTGHMMWYIMSEVDEFNKAVGRCKQSLAALIVPLDIRDRSDAGALECPRGEIRFNHVTFHYKNTTSLFHAQSVIIQAGQKVGLVGYSGGGKSTFVNLILRLYDVIDGAILIDGQDIRSVTQDSLREKIAMIPQEPSLFHRSVRDNIRYSCLCASDAGVIEAAKNANAHEFIEKLPQGYDTLVGERGVKLSGGQRQRIAIARAILRNAPILMFDEATSQLDSVTERLIQESLWELMHNKTTIVIAHRLSTLMRMDRILVFDNGKIVEDGAHSELIAKAGLYKKLWDSQVGGFLCETTQEDML